jgi:hypothetical protein
MVRVIVYQEDGQWLAQGLEYDLTSQAPSPQQAIESFGRIFGARVQKDIKLGRKPLHGIGPAPEEFFDRWQGDHLGAEETLSPDPHSEVPPAYVIHQISASSNHGSNTTNS